MVNFIKIGKPNLSPTYRMLLYQITNYELFSISKPVWLNLWSFQNAIGFFINKIKYY